MRFEHSILIQKWWSLSFSPKMRVVWLRNLMRGWNLSPDRSILSQRTYSSFLISWTDSFHWLKSLSKRWMRTLRGSTKTKRKELSENIKNWWKKTTSWPADFILRMVSIQKSLKITSKLDKFTPKPMILCYPSNHNGGHIYQSLSFDALGIWSLQNESFAL